jgi:hypothetical protein
MNPLWRDLEAAADPVALARRAGFEPHDYQVAVLRSTARQLILNWSRQAGKSSITAFLPVHTAMYKPGSLTLILGPGERQAALLLKKVYDVIDALGRDVAMTETENVLNLRLANGSEIHALPGKEGTIRGFSGVDLLVIDEAAKASDELYFTVRPMLAASMGRIVLLSTPFGRRGFFHDVWFNGGDRWDRHEVPVTRVPHISAEFLDEERQGLPEIWFAQEYLCRFSEMAGAVFSLEQIERAMSDPSVTPLFSMPSPTGPFSDRLLTPLPVTF